MTYCLEDAVVDRIEFIFQTKIGNKGNTKSVSIKEGSETLEGRTIRIQDDPAVAGRALTLCDLDIKVRYRRGDMVETDVNCDSTFMLAAMDRVGQAIRSAYHWIPSSDPCYLVMDNTSGHGTNDAIDEYVSALKTKWNVETIFQIPRSPYTNVLDLGV